MELFFSNLKNPFSILLLQIIVIFLLSRLLGVILRKLGQPTVLGEILAGIMLGPSILGLFLPGVFAFVFPANSLVPLQVLSQIGLVFFMFIIGMELDLNKIGKNTKNVIIISQASILIPFIFGMLLSYFIFEEFATKNTTFLSFSLFMGIAMSITAFPVLARIIKERGLSKTPLGILALTCAAANDAVAWCLLALVVALAKSGNIADSMVTIGLTIGYVLTMLYFIKPLFKKLSIKNTENGYINKSMVALSFFLALCSAYVTEIIGIHFLFGAFFAGVIMPNSISFKQHLSNKLEDVSTLILMPVFFAFVGLRTQIGLLNSTHLWIACAIVIATAVAGKFGGTVISAKMLRYSWKDSFSLGALMNTRGLMELIVLNLGYDLGILNSEIFTILVIMALVTTFMTGPILNFIEYMHKKLVYGK